MPAFRWFVVPGRLEDHVIDDSRIAPAPLCGLRDRRNITWRPSQGDRPQCGHCRTKLIALAEGVAR